MYGITVSHVYRPSWSWEDLKLSVFTFRLRTALHALRNTYFESLYYASVHCSEACELSFVFPKPQPNKLDSVRNAV